jgi:ParB family chromosome partitioning protein
MPTFQTIPLNQLILSASNVRLTGRTDGIASLAASIGAHGLRQNLNVLATKDPKRFAVVAGQRRLRALKTLAKQGKVAKNEPIPCMLLAEGEDAPEISLAENIQRVNMHPDDQCEAFRAMIEERGASIEDVAARFGVTATLVRQRLKLANVSPKLRVLYRKGEMTLAHMTALAISDDHAAQEQAWDNLPDWNRAPHLLRQALTHDMLAPTDKLARFVGIEAYVSAGGAIVRDLFDAEDQGYLSDAGLLQRLATEKMAQAIEGLQAEGWKWVKPELEYDHETHYRYVQPESDGEGDEDSEPAYSADAKAKAGARLYLRHDGQLGIERGLVHPDDAVREPEAENEDGNTQQASGPALPARMVQELTAHRTAALRVELARNPAMALAASVHALALEILYREPFQSCLALKASSEPLERHTKAMGDSPAHEALAELGAAWGERLPEDAGSLFSWCIAQPQDVLLDLLAYLSALTVNAVELRSHARGDDSPADRLASALALDMRRWWTPTPEGFFERLPRAMLAEAVREAQVPPLGVSLTNVKKAEAARLAERALSGSGWLPQPLRPALPAAA